LQPTAPKTEDWINVTDASLINSGNPKLNCAKKNISTKYLTGDRYDYASCAVVHETATPYVDDVARDPQPLLGEEYDAE
jgi:hypothetical protein